MLSIVLPGSGVSAHIRGSQANALPKFSTGFRKRRVWNRVSSPRSTFLTLASLIYVAAPIVTMDELNSASEERKGEQHAARPVFRHAGFSICPATLLISSLRSASSVFPATQETAFDSRQMVLPAGMFTVSSEL